VAILGASRQLESTGGHGGSEFRCAVEQVRVHTFTVDLVLVCTIAPHRGGMGGGLNGRGGGGGPGGADSVAYSSTGLTVTVTSAEIVGLPGWPTVSRALSVGCVNDFTWRPTPDGGSTVISSSARVEARGDESVMSRGLVAALGLPVVGDVVRTAVEAALELAIRTSVEGSVGRVAEEYGQWAPGAAERVRRDRARGLAPAAMEDAAAAAAADEELRRIRAENAELRRQIAMAEAAWTTNISANSNNSNNRSPPPPPPPLPPPSNVASQQFATAMGVSPNNNAKDDRVRYAMDTYDFSSPINAGAVIKPSASAAAATAAAAVAARPHNGVQVPTEPALVDDSIIKEWELEVDVLTAEYKRSSHNMYCINSRRTLKLPIDQRGNSVAFSGWLADPQRVVGLVYPPQSVKRHGKVYEIELVQLSFFQFQFVPVYELHILWHNNKLLAKSGTVKLRQEGLPDWAKNMELNMRMVCETAINPTASAVHPTDEVLVEAFAELEIAADLPGMFRNIPGSQGIGNAILDTILLAIEVIAKTKLQAAYTKWARSFPPGSGPTTEIKAR